MKLRNKGLAFALTATLGMGVAGEVAADVYGISSLEIDNLNILFGNPPDATVNLFTFSTNQDAILNGSPDLSAGNAACSTFVACGGAPNPRLSGTVQNAPGGGAAATRGENDYTKFGNVAEYSNAESAIETAILLGDATTRTRQIAESNLQTGTGAQANTNVASSSFVSVAFTLEGGILVVDFDAIIDVMTEVTGGDIGLAQASSSVSLVLTDDAGVTLVSWAPDGTGNVTTCVVGLTCTATEEDNLAPGAAVSLNNSSASAGVANQVAGDGSYNIFIMGLADGDYQLALAATGVTDLLRAPVPLPGTLLLMGAGLLVGARTLRRK